MNEKKDVKYPKNNPPAPPRPRPTNCNRRLVEYRLDELDIEGRKWGKKRPQHGYFIDFAEDYKIVVIETMYGEVIRIPSDGSYFHFDDEEQSG